VKQRSLLIVFVAIMLALLGYPAVANHSSEPHQRLQHIAHDENPGTTNSDLAFWGNILAFGTYDGFRLFNISNPSSPKELVDFPCNGGQGDVTLHKAGDRLLLFRSIDSPQDRPECAGSRNVPTQNQATTPTLFEGIRILDVTNPTEPKFIKGVYTDCGSHTHTTIRDTKNKRAIIYIASYPLGSPTPDPDGAGQHDGCKQPHQKIGIVVVPNGNPSAAQVHHYQQVDAPPAGAPIPGHADAPLQGTIGCHDITAFTHPKVHTAAAACITDAQLWDISNPLFPCTTDDSCHTHIDNPSVEIWHSSAFSWDGKIVMASDEHTGAVTGPGCFGSEDSTGNVWFYQNVKPGTPTAPLLGRYHIPRAQPSSEVCSIHNYNVIPVDGSRSYIGVSASYSGGTTVFDFTQAKTATPTTLQGSAVPILAEEVAFWDTSLDSDGEGNNDVWSAYWYNNFIYANDITRGLDVYKFLRESGAQFTALKFGFHNPQTQEKLILP
jgi:hypothetical protein